MNFEGYCKFFFLEDCVSDDYSAVKLWLPCDPFQKMYPLPCTVEEYLLWIDSNLQFVEKRNKRIKDYIEQQCKE